MAAFHPKLSFALDPFLPLGDLLSLSRASRSLREVLLTPLVARLSGSNDKIARRLLGGLGSDLDVHAIRSVEKDLTVLSTHLSCFVVKLTVFICRKRQKLPRSFQLAPRWAGRI